MQNPKSQILNSKQIQITETQNPKHYDLEERTFEFARKVRLFIKRLPRNVSNIEDARQLNNSSGSIGANYIEANESLSKKDFVMRIKICRKEAKETRYWLRLIDVGADNTLDAERQALIAEVSELTKIFGSILEKSK